jgi:hypothetical protein
MWGALSDERTGLSFTTAPGPRQRSHFRIRVRGTRDQILLSQIRDFPFPRLLGLVSYGGGIWPRLHTGVHSYSRNSQNFMESEGSFPCSQETSTGSYHEPDQTARPQVAADGGDGLQLWRVAANILNK